MNKRDITELKSILETIQKLAEDGEQINPMSKQGDIFCYIFNYVEIALGLIHED